jgi:hypothetical protein
VRKTGEYAYAKLYVTHAQCCGVLMETSSLNAYAALYAAMKRREQLYVQSASFTRS